MYSSDKNRDPGLRPQAEFPALPFSSCVNLDKWLISVWVPVPNFLRGVENIQKVQELEVMFVHCDKNWENESCHYFSDHTEFIT